MTRAFIIQIEIDSPEEVPSVVAELETILEPIYDNVTVRAWESPGESSLSTPTTNFPLL